MSQDVPVSSQVPHFAQDWNHFVDLMKASRFGTARSHWTGMLSFFPIDELKKLGWFPVASLDEGALKSAFDAKLKNWEGNSVKWRDLLELTVNVDDASVPVFFQRKVNPAAESSQVTSADAVASKLAFDESPFLNKPYLEFFCETLAEYARAWKTGGGFYSPMTALINASMTGKSRLIHETVEMGIFPLTVCLREQAFDFFRPQQTSALLQWAYSHVSRETQGRFTNQCCILLRQLLLAFNVWLKCESQPVAGVSDLARAWRKYSGDPKNPMWATIHEAVAADEDPVSNLENTTVDNIIENWRSLNLPLLADIAKNLAMLTPGESHHNKLRILLCFDEARGINICSQKDQEGCLLKFPLLRRAMRSLPLNTPEAPFLVFCVVTDTISKLANLAPAKNFITSGRTASEGIELYPPFTLIKTVDIWWKRFENLPVSADADAAELLRTIDSQWRQEEQVSLHSPAGEMSATHKYDGAEEEGGNKEVRLRERVNLELLSSFEFMAAFGRPAYFGFHKHRNYDKAAGTVAVLEAKLLGGAVAGKGKEGGFTKGQALGVLGALVSIEISAPTGLASELCSEYMRLTAAISEDRECVYTLEVSEPPLALAAHSLILKQVITWETILKKFVSSALRCTTSVGFRGEVAAQILFIMAFQQLLKPSFIENRFSLTYFPSFTALQLLNSLLGGKLEGLESGVVSGKRPFSAVEMAPIAQQLEKAHVRLYQFVKTFADPSCRMLLEYFIRGAGVYCKELQQLVDLAIPMCPSGECVSEENVSAILVQVKLQSKFVSDGYKADWVNQIQNIKFLAKTKFFVAVFLEFGPRDSSLESEIEIRKFPRGIAIFCKRPSPKDIASMEGLSERFQHMLRSTVDPAEVLNVRSEEKHHIKDMFQCQPYMELNNQCV